MSVRENIAQNIAQVLGDITTPPVRLVSRNPIGAQDISDVQYPAVFISSGDEEREDITQGTTTALRSGNIDYTITGLVRAASSAITTNNNIDTQRNELLEAISEKLEEDRTRNGNALNSYITDVEVDDGTAYPTGKIIVTYRVVYKYVRGTL